MPTPTPLPITILELPPTVTAAPSDQVPIVKAADGKTYRITAANFSAQGAQGAQGNQGLIGPQGEVGPQGGLGTQGAQGAQGTGLQGAIGAQGSQGDHGPQGFQGPQGAMGAQGQQGQQGASGAQGGVGAQGSVGAQGGTGAQGNQGVQGPAGTGTIGVVLGDRIGVIPPGQAGYVRVPYAHSILSATLLAEQTGSLVIDVWRDTFANYPPTVADTITASAKPTLSSEAKSEDTALTGWSTTGSAGDVYGFNVDSCSGVRRAVLELKVLQS